MTASTTDIALALDTTPRELRKFLRSDASGFERVGKGARYALPSTKRDLAKMRANFDAWREAKATKSTDEVDNDATD